MKGIIPLSYILDAGIREEQLTISDDECIEPEQIVTVDIDKDGQLGAWIKGKPLVFGSKKGWIPDDNPLSSRLKSLYIHHVLKFPQLLEIHASGYEVLTKRATACHKTAAQVYVPITWTGKEVLVIRRDP